VPIGLAYTQRAGLRPLSTRASRCDNRRLVDEELVLNGWDIAAKSAVVTEDWHSVGIVAVLLFAA